MDRRPQASTASWRTINPSKWQRHCSCDGVLCPLPDNERTAAQCRRLVIATSVSRDTMEETT